MNVVALLITAFTIVELNCENLFDCQHDTLKNDYEYLPTSDKRWTPDKYWHKLNRTAQEIMSCSRDVKLPDIVVLCEVENDSVMRDLSRRSALRHAGYAYVMTQSEDARGIDVAMMYQPQSFRLLTHYSLRPSPLEGHAPTRDILYVSGMTRRGDTLHVFGLHLPSRIGAGQNMLFRHHVSAVLRHSIDSILSISTTAKIIVAGDCNDFAGSDVLKEICGAELVNISEQAVGGNGAEGTYRYKGEWHSLDHIMASEVLARNVKDCHVNDAPFLMEKETKYGGVKPKRTYNGYKYNNGYSDHLPLVAEIEGL